MCQSVTQPVNQSQSISQFTLQSVRRQSVRQTVTQSIKTVHHEVVCTRFGYQLKKVGRVFLIQVLLCLGKCGQCFNAYYKVCSLFNNSLKKIFLVLLYCILCVMKVPKIILNHNFSIRFCQKK